MKRKITWIVPLMALLSGAFACEAMQPQFLNLKWARFSEESPDKKTIITSSGDNVAKLWDGETKQLLTIFRLPSHETIMGVALGGPPGQALIGTDSLKAYIGNTATGEIIRVINLTKETY